MKDYDNLYALKGMTCRDMDGDGMKDIVVLARYSYAGPEGELLVETKCDIYYQRVDGFVEDTEFGKSYQCTEKDTMAGMVEIIRENKSFFPGKSNLANPYPTNTEDAIVTSTVGTVSLKEFAMKSPME